MIELKFRCATLSDADLYYNWANDPEVRKNSYQSEIISYSDHLHWFGKKLDDPNCLLLVFYDENTFIEIGQVRFSLLNEYECIIGISIDKKYRGGGLACDVLKTATEHYHVLHPEVKLIAYIKKANLASKKSFMKAGFINFEETEYMNEASYKTTKYDLV